MKIKIKNEEIKTLLNIETPEFPKYTTQIINLANQNAQGTRPKVVGQLSDLIEESGGIDGYIGDIPVSIKPETYQVKMSLREDIPVKMIYYKKVKDGIVVDYSAVID